MRLINVRSRRGFVNLFADYILSYLKPFEEESVIQVTDCTNFLVVGGITSFKEILNLTEIKKKFFSEFKNLYPEDKHNIIDLIEYKGSISSKHSYFGTFYNSSRPIYHQDQLSDDIKDFSYNEYCQISEGLIYSMDNIWTLQNAFPEPLHVSSEFPYGNSMNNGRNKLYYLEYISYNLIEIFGIQHLNYNWFNEVELSCNYLQETVDSMMKDVFDFNLTSFTTKLKDYDILQDILSPTKEKPWLVKDKVGELIIV